MKFRRTLPALLGWLAVCFLAWDSVGAQAKDLKCEASLVWATNAEKSPDPKHRPVSEDVRKKLDELPLRWRHYFLVNSRQFSIPLESSAEVGLSDKCRLKVRDVDGKNVEVSLIGKGESVLKRIQPLPKGEMLVLGGNAPDSTGWLVVLKRFE